MHKLLPIFLAILLLPACTIGPPPQPDRTPPAGAALRLAMDRISAIMVTDTVDLGPWIDGGFSSSNAPKDTDAGTGCPITADGYFLTADHVIKNASKKTMHVIYGRGYDRKTSPARVVWRDTKNDLALIHADISTPRFYRFTPPSITLPEGTPVFHGGLTTGLKPLYGTLSSTVPAQSLISSAQKFIIDIPLQPGDSGGPILDARANLIGVNSSVEFLIPMETPIFTNSHGVRPNIAKLMKIIAKDRRK